MTDAQLIPRFKTALSDILEETFEKVMGQYLDRGTSLFETLEPITAETASRPVSATCANLAAQVNHVRIYLDCLTRGIMGEDVKVDWDASWQVGEVTDDEWAGIKRELRSQVDTTIATLKSIERWDGEDQIDGVFSIIAHTAYHLGEIRQALCTLNA
jgi:hypothetical protein